MISILAKHISTICISHPFCICKMCSQFSLSIEMLHSLSMDRERCYNVGDRLKNALRGGLSHIPPKFEYLFVAVITFSLFFCADTFNTSLLLIVCSLRCYVKCLYRHLFLEDISKHARVIKKIAPPKLEHV